MPANFPITTVQKPPTIDSPVGGYRVVDAQGRWWGNYCVRFNWARQKYVSYADQDYLPAIGPQPDLYN